jgi:proteasome activator subunit 4
MMRTTAAGGTMGYLSTLTGIFENYYHPSNGGSWSNSLTYFLRYLTGYLKKRLVTEEEYRRGVAWTPPVAWGGPLAQSQRTAMATLILRLCRNAHFSKTNVLSQVRARLVLPTGSPCVRSKVKLPWRASPALLKGPLLSREDHRPRRNGERGPSLLNWRC